MEKKFNSQIWASTHTNQNSKLSISNSSIGSCHQNIRFPSNAKSKLVFIGLLTIPSKIERRTLVRMTYLRMIDPEKADFYFVFGKPESEHDRRIIKYESDMYGDIITLDCKENLDDGKTYSFFNHVGNFYSNGTYKFVLKTDDDVWLHIPNLIKDLQKQPTSGTYYGREVPNTGFMAGMGYALSWDLVYWIAHDSYPAENSIGQEDATLAGWLHHHGLIKNWQTDTTEAFYDEPDSNKGWAHAYTPNTILIHQLKNSEWFMKASEHFVLNI